MFRINLWTLFIGLIIVSCKPGSEPAEESKPGAAPNIIYILADDLGYGDLSAYGQEKFQTPNIDRLAAEGMLFTDHYAGTTVCAPSRCALMTGMHTGHAYIRGNREWKPEGQWPIPDSIFTLAEMLKEEGYSTGAFGKWGLGFIETPGNPNDQGFDRFYGYNCQRLAHNYYPYHLWDNKEKVVLEGNSDRGTAVYGPVKIHEQALNFLRENKDHPFFLYYPSVIPHAELVAPEQYMTKFRDKFLPETQYEGVDDGETYRLGPYGSQEECHAAFAAMVSLLDEQVGEILDLVKELGLEENTLIMFTSDNGPHLEGGADPDYFDSNGPFTGYKRDLYEGGIRVPMLAKWKGHVAPGSRTDHPSAFWDVMPTIAELINYDLDKKIDGISFLPTLLNEGSQKEHDYLYWEFHEKGGRKALRQGDWKIVKYDLEQSPDQTPQLFNLKDDPSESHDLAEENPEKLQELSQLMKNARTPNEVFKLPGEE
ncbi:MAG: arylsulfatase [Saprospiraceae bacterium]|nr:arylsulfatase [Saprospiraceae bacterium]